MKSIDLDVIGGTYYDSFLTNYTFPAAQQFYDYLAKYNMAPYHTPLFMAA